MKLGMVGLGRMGGNMTKRLENDGHVVQTYARSGGGTASSFEDLVDQLEPRRAVWLMIPAGDPTEAAVTQLLDLLQAGDKGGEVQPQPQEQDHPFQEDGQPDNRAGQQRPHADPALLE